jgi:nucleoside-diphosphate-sugar epimerase
MGCAARLIPIPSNYLKLIASALGKREITQRLCDSLQVDIGKTRRLLNWSPPITLDQGLAKVAEADINEKNR